MKRAISVIILLLGLVSGIFCQNSGPVDLVMVLDTSASMSSSYRETSDYLVGPFLREFLRIGDTFHLISFSGAPKLEISRRIEGVGDVETVVARILLLYPLDPESDLGGALNFAENYSSSLPGGKPKKIVLLTDGDTPDTQTLVNDAQGRLRNRGTELQYIKLPVTGNGPSSGRPAQTAGNQGQSAAASPRPAVPAEAATSQETGGATPSSPQASETGQGAVSQLPSGAGPSQTGTETPSQQGQETGTSPSQGASQTAGNQGQSAATSPRPVVPAETATSRETELGSQPAGSSSPFIESLAGLPLPLLIGLALLALLILALIIFFVSRRLHNSPNQAMAKAAAPVDSQDAKLMGSYAESQRKAAAVRPPLEQRAPERKPMPKDKVDNFGETNGGPVMLNLFVADQNTAIGRRNIHTVKSGYTFSVGGGKSDFLIFLVPFPPHIADVQFDGRNCTFIPRKPQYFPDIGSQSVPSCIGKNIRVISDKNYELHIRIERYEDPLTALNKMLHSISVPGPA